MTTVAVIGAGNIGGTLARKWVAAGHEVVIGARDPEKADADIGASAAGLREAGDRGEVVVLAIPASAVPDVVREVAPALDGKIVIDATNNVRGPQMNSIEVITGAAPGAIPARAFNTLGWENLADPWFDGVQADLLWCGPDGAAGEVVERMISDVGLRPVRVGGIDQAGVVDSVTGLWFALAIGQKRGRHLAFKVLSG